MNIDGVFNNLRQKLDSLGYNQSLPLSAIPLVGALFEDLVKTTAQTLDSKLQIKNLLEEKSCWELGVEPYKCDNSRLLSECNQLHLELIKVKEDCEENICNYAQKIRSLESDKRYLQDHCQQLEQQVKVLTLRNSDAKSMKSKKEAVSANKKPFVSAVRSGEIIPNPLTQEVSKCTKCHACTTRHPSGIISCAIPVAHHSHEMEKLQNNIKELSDQLSYYKKKIEVRDREICRLNELLSGGRPPAALAKDCCYKDVGALSDDIEFLQREKVDNFSKIREYQDNMHEAMQRAVVLADRNKKLQKELDDLKETALSVETQANSEIAQREKEIDELRREMDHCKKKIEKIENADMLDCDRKVSKISEEKRRFNERVNVLTQKESELSSEILKLQKKNQKLKLKVNASKKESEERFRNKDDRLLDEEKMRFKTERDFFQNEYLKLIANSDYKREVDFFQSQIRAKDDELRQLRADFNLLRQQQPTARSQKSSSSECVQAIVLRAERERDVVRAEMERLREERDVLRENLQTVTQKQLNEHQRYQEQINEVNARLLYLEKENRDLSSARIPGQTQIILLKEEIDQLKKSLFELQNENCTLKTSNSQLKALQNQTERALLEYQNKYAVAETHLETAESRLNTLGTNRETSRNEIGSLRNEIIALKSTYLNLENEKDKILSELDAKTELAYKMESELKALKDQNNNLEQTVQTLRNRLEKQANRSKEHETAFHETSSESKTLRREITALKKSRDEAIAENNRLSSDLADSQSEVITLKRKLKESGKEIERLKQQLKQYVQEVQKAEDLLMKKEREREEMLDHYRCLSHDAVVLEGTNQSLEVETAEQRRQLSEAEEEIIELKQELVIKAELIEKLERQIGTLSSQNSCLEKELEQVYDDQRLLRVDLDARKELCDKLDLQKDKLNAELMEANEIRRKLERDNEKLRKDTVAEMSASSNAMEPVLSQTRQHLEEKIKNETRLILELTQKQEEIKELQKNLSEEREKCQIKEATVREKDVQIQELRHNLTDDRFKQARSREQSPRYYTTM